MIACDHEASVRVDEFVDAAVRFFLRKVIHVVAKHLQHAREGGGTRRKRWSHVLSN